MCIRDRAGLAAALAVGGDIYVDDNVTINLTAQMNIAVPTRLLGGRFARSAGCVFYVTSSDVEIAGCRIDGGGQGAGYDINQKLIYVQGAKGSPLARVNIHDNVLYGSRGDSIWIEWCVGSKVHHNTISTYLYSGIMAISCVGCNFDNNNISDGMLASGLSLIHI